MRVIFLPTIQHTGTWFCIDLLRLHRDISFVGTWKTMTHADLSEVQNTDGIALIQAHFGEGTSPYCGPKELESFAPFEAVEALISKSDSIVVPVRDPLLVMLTAHVRNPDVRHDHIINGFLLLVQWCQKNDIFLVPVDLYASRSVEDRYLLIRDLFAFVGISDEPYMSIWAQDWPVVNTVGQRLGENVKGLYYSRQVFRVVALIPEDFDALVQHEAELRPFLEDLGYRNLLWWS